MFSFQGASQSYVRASSSFPHLLRFLFDYQVSLSRNSMKPRISSLLQSISWWWRVPGSNRWPPACKAGALPAELTPHRVFTLKELWWAKMDSNHRPHDYQSCALASWAIGPYQGSTILFSTVPSKLNNVKTLTSCTDLRTLLTDALLC